MNHFLNVKARQEKKSILTQFKQKQVCFKSSPQVFPRINQSYLKTCQHFDVYEGVVFCLEKLRIIE